jgi:hypothetical protein
MDDIVTPTVIASRRLGTEVPTSRRALVRSLALASLLLFAPAASAADFNDSDFHQEVWFEWDAAHLDVLILPPQVAYAPFRQQVLLDNVQNWADAIAGHGVSWLAGGVDLVAYAPGLQAAPPAGFELNDPDIIVALNVEPGAVGAAILTDWCSFLPDVSGHQHPGSPVQVSLYTAVGCSGAEEPVCVITNTNWQTTQQGLFRLNGHEFGHCLGLGHVGDAGDFTVNNVPTDDVMSYVDGVSGCASSLDLFAMQGAFAAVLGESQPAVDVLDGVRYVREAPSAHVVYSCDGPTPVPLGLPDPDWFPL